MLRKIAHWQDTLRGLRAFSDLPRDNFDDLISKHEADQAEAPHKSSTGGFADRQRVFSDNRLPEKKSKTIWELAWTTYNDRVLILLTIAAVVSLALGLFQTFGTPHKPGQPKVEWVEGVAIMVAIFIVVLVGTLNDWQMERQFNKLNEKHNDRNVKVSTPASTHIVVDEYDYQRRVELGDYSPIFSLPTVQ